MTYQKLESDFVRYLRSLDANPRKRGDLAHLRRGLGRLPGTVTEMYPVVVDALPDNLDDWGEQMHYLVAALFALHPSFKFEGDMGAHFAELGNPKEPPSEALERRFITLLNARPANLYRILPPIINRLKVAGIPIFWEQLLDDLQRWQYPTERQRVRKRWADTFWKRTMSSLTKDEQTDTDDIQNQDQN
jgi:CRISPR system Cascade subunit CasB